MRARKICESLVQTYLIFELMKSKKNSGRVKKLGLKSLTSAFLGIELNKDDWKVRSRGWENPTLSAAHIEYAANDAFVSINVAIAIAIEQEPIL